MFGIDTEFQDNKSGKYYQSLALIQVSIRSEKGIEIFIIDPISNEIGDLSEIKNIFFSESKLKIFHSSENDIPILKNSLNKDIKNVFDTQIAYLMTNCKDRLIGYGSLVKEILNIDVEKKLQMSNWLRRPLKKELIDYSAIDVEYLIDLYEILKERLIKIGNYDQFLFEMTNLNKENNKYFQSYKKSETEIKNMSALERTRFININAIREEISIGFDIKREKIFSDFTIEKMIFLDKAKAIEFVKSDINYDAFGKKFIQYIEDKWLYIDDLNDKFLFRDIKKIHNIKNKIDDIVKKASIKNNLSKLIIISRNEEKELAKLVYLKKDPRERLKKIFSNWRMDLIGGKILTDFDFVL